MTNELTIPDPTTVLMLTHLGMHNDGRMGPVRHDLRNRQRRHLRLTRLRKLLA